MRSRVCDTRVLESVAWVVALNEARELHRLSSGELLRKHVDRYPHTDRWIKTQPRSTDSASVIGW